MASPSYTFTLTNGQTADASQVMQNFNDILNGIIDGTKDISVASLTAAGTTTLNGGLNFGNSSSDNLIILASLAGDLPIKTNSTYNLGSATLGLLGLYIGGTSTFTTQIAGAATASYTITLPPVVPLGDDYVMRFTTAGVATFTHPGKTAGAAADTDTTLALTSKRIQIVTPTAARTYTLPTTGVKAGDSFMIINKAATTTVFNVLINSSGGNLITTCAPGHYQEVTALQDTPTTAAHWYSLDTYSTRHQVRVNTTNGYGATNVAIRRWTTTVENVGTAITYADSAANGGSFTVTEAGIYAISYSDVFSTTAIFGISLNSTQLSTGINGITTADRLAIQLVRLADLGESCGWTGYLAAGDIIRGHADTNTDSAGAKAQGMFTITKIR